jgi:hypothetical protein
VFTLKEIAMALGIRDRIMGVDADARRITLARFRGVRDLEHAYYCGWREADGYCANCWTWGASARSGSGGCYGSEITAQIRPVVA